MFLARMVIRSGFVATIGCNSISKSYDYDQTLSLQH